MNKIELVGNKIVLNSVNDDIKVTINDSEKFLNVVVLNIKVLKDTTLFLDYKNEDYKINVKIDVVDNTNLELKEFSMNNNVKIQYQFSLGKNSVCNINKFTNNLSTKEIVVASLNGENASFNYVVRGINTTKSQNNIIVYHNNIKQNSNISNHVLNINDGSYETEVSGYVPNNIIDCNVNQDSHIINLTNNKCSIHPNLFIDENDVVANHSANIGSFNEQELFYLGLKGIDKETAIKILSKGFLTSNLNLDDNYKEEIEKILNSYWR